MTRYKLAVATVTLAAILLNVGIAVQFFFTVNLSAEHPAGIDPLAAAIFALATYGSTVLHRRILHAITAKAAAECLYQEADVRGRYLADHPDRNRP